MQYTLITLRPQYKGIIIEAMSMNLLSIFQKSAVVYVAPYSGNICDRIFNDGHDYQSGVGMINIHR